jgi:hypothetical protein
MEYGLRSTSTANGDYSDSWDLEDDIYSNNKEMFAKLTARVAALEAENKEVHKERKGSHFFSKGDKGNNS